MDRLLTCYRAFDRLPFLAKRAIYTVLLVLLALYGTHVGRTDPHNGGNIIFVAWVGIMWSTGLWIPLWILLRLVIFFKVRP
ncbi:hypothetical protein [Paraburkholderia sediminicola]|uniref:hypothetical protein n=1 Tax=Paraburkholderia sediminicola TaxID=458836 RepID=UPI0038B7C0E8